jgi:two-component system, OmpR family, response regulator RegX3
VSIGLHDELAPLSREGSELARVLLVSGLDHWADRIESDLTAEGFLVLRDRTGEWVFDEQRIRDVHIVVVDLRLRAQSGLAVCGAVRARSLVPILALGDQTDEAPVLAAYSAGADQYVTIDTSMRLVTARLRALLRRVPPRSAAPITSNPDLAVTIDEASGSVRVDGAVVSLSKRELEVLRTLLSRPGRVVTRAELAGAWPALSADRRLDFVIRRLRQKLEMVDGRRRINSVRGVGFRFEEDDGLGSADGGRA